MCAARALATHFREPHEITRPFNARKNHAQFTAQSARIHTALCVPTRMLEIIPDEVDGRDLLCKRRGKDLRPPP